MPMTADQAKAAVTEAVLGAVGELAGALHRGSETPETFAAMLATLQKSEALAHRLIDKAFETPKDEPKATESDDDYRARLGRIVGTGSVHYARLQLAVGRALDDIGMHYDAKRK